MIVVLSRATIDAGADMNEILCGNTSFMRELERMQTLEEISAWVTAVLRRFINYTIDFETIKHSDAVFKVMEYVRNNYNSKLTLDILAKQALFSRAYLSSVFKKETGKGLFAYINTVRIEKSKILLEDRTIRLIDVAGMCGFEDQSYFTRVFKNETGMSPKIYRESRIKI